MSRSDLCRMAEGVDQTDAELAARLGDGYDLESEALALPPDEFSFGFFHPPADPCVLPDFTNLDQETQERLQHLLHAAGITKCEGKSSAMFADPEVLRRLSTSVSSALDDAADALARMKASGVPPKDSAPHKMAPTCDRLDEDPSAGVMYSLAQAPGTPVSVEEGESLLSLACSAGYYELAQVLLAMRTNIEDRGSKGDCTPLMEASSAGHVDIVKLLITHGADVNAQSSTGCTPLMYACAGGHEEVVSILLEAGADVEMRNENGHCPLMEAASAGHVDIAKALVKHNASVQSVGSAEFKVGLESPLTLASYKGHIEMVKFLLRAGPKSSKRLEELHTALMEASMDGHLDVAKILLDFGAPVNLASDSFESPLTLAACGGHVDLVRLLLDRGAQIEDPNDEGYTPLMEAAREGHDDVVDLLLERGAEINAQTEETGETALTLAACGGFREVVELLVRRGADLDLGANTPLMEAAQEGHLDTVKFLIQATLSQGDLSIDASTATGDTALTYAAENGHTDVCAALLDAGAQIDHEAEAGRTALMKSSKAGHYCTVQFLLAKGANVNKTSTANEQTALSLSCANGQGDVVQLLLQCGANPNHKLKDSATCIIEAAKGGFTHVVQLLLDWPGIKLPKFTSVPPSLQHLAAANAPSSPANKPACALEKATVQQQKPLKPQAHYQQPPPLAEEPEARPPSAFNMTLDPQFLASVQKHQQQQQVLQTPRTAQELAELFYNTDPSISSDWLMMQAQKALLKQAHGQLNKSEFEQFTQLLKSTQMRIPAPVDSSSLDPSSPSPPTSAPEAPPAGQGVKRKATGANLETAMKDLKKLQEAGTKVMAQQGTQTPSATASNKPKSGQQPPGMHSKVPTLEMPDGSVVRADGTVVKSDGSIVKASGFNLQLPPPPPPTAPPKVVAQPKTGVPPQKVNAATQVGASVVGGNKTGQPTQGGGSVDLNTQTESNHDTALTLACAGGHEELVSLLLQRGADLEHKDKKGFTPLILAATAGYVNVVEALLTGGASIEAQSERTKDTALSLACSSGRKEVVEVLLKHSANKEHRNVSDYTPLSLAASGGYVDIVQLLLNAGAEINSRTGSKLGISPLMLAAMNGHAAAVKLLLERGSDINAQIETNRNTALTLACFQGRHEVVKLLLDYRANVEHRAKTGLTPLMEAASGGYVEVGKVLLEYGADPNAAPVPSSRDTALTIAADKGHHKFVDLLLHHRAQIDARNKKGCTSLWLACHTGHLETVQTLVKHEADVDAQDNRRVTPLMAAFRKGHVKVVKWMVRHVQQFPSDQECSRFIATITDKDQLIKCRQCMEVTVAAKDRQALEANKAAETLLEEIAKEEEQAASRKLAKQRQKEKKKAKKQAKKAAQRQPDDDDMKTDDKATRDSSLSSPSPPPPPAPQRIHKTIPQPQDDDSDEDEVPSPPLVAAKPEAREAASRVPLPPEEPAPPTPVQPKKPKEETPREEKRLMGRRDRYANRRTRNGPTVIVNKEFQEKSEKQRLSTRPAEPIAAEDWNRASQTRRRGPARAVKEPSARTTQAQATVHPDDPYTTGWREVRRRANKLVVSSQAIARVIGRGGQNINAIREATGAHIEVEKQQPKKEQQERLITIRGTADASRQAVLMINGLIKDSESPVHDIIRSVREKDEQAWKSYAPSDSSVVTTVASSGQKKAFPDVTVWSSQALAAAAAQAKRPSDVVYTVAECLGAQSTNVTSVTTTTTSSAPSAEYSPFATPNVWAQRAALRQMQQQQSQDGPKKMDFASVAAANVPHSVAHVSPPPPAVAEQQPADECKAPGFMRPSTRTAPSPVQPVTVSPPSELVAPGDNGNLSPPLLLGQSKSAFTSPAPAAVGVELPKYNTAVPLYERPASATPTLGLSVEPHPFSFPAPTSLSPPVSSVSILQHNSLTQVTQAQPDPLPSTGFSQPDWMRSQLGTVDWSDSKPRDQMNTAFGIGNLSANLAQLQIQNDESTLLGNRFVNGPGGDWSSNGPPSLPPKFPQHMEPPPRQPDTLPLDDVWLRQLAEAIQSAGSRTAPAVPHPQFDQHQMFAGPMSHPPPLHRPFEAPAPGGHPGFLPPPMLAPSWPAGAGDQQLPYHSQAPQWSANWM